MQIIKIIKFLLASKKQKLIERNCIDKKILSYAICGSFAT